MSARNIVAAPSSPFAMMIAKPAPSAPVMNHLSPLMTQWLPSCTAVVFSADGSEPAPGAGSVMQKQERMSPRASGRSQRSFCSVRRDRFQQMHVALVGREDVQRDRPEQRIAGLLEHDRLADIVQPEAAEFRRRMRRQQPRLAPKRHQFAAEFLGRPVRGLPRIALQRHDPVANEAARALLQFLQLGRERKIHQNARPWAISWANSTIPVPIAVRPA